MLVIIQIPAFNEEETLGTVLSELPRRLSGVTRVEWLVIDDGSSDATARVARAGGTDHLLRFSQHRGLAAAFSVGIEACLELGADIIVNTDADNQYRATDIAKLIEPILRGSADMVVGARPVSEIPEFSGLKKFLQRFGSRVVRALSRTDIVDTTSGFRAFRRSAALRLKVFGDYTYTLETIIHAGRKGMAVTSVPIRTNRVTRPSRLVKSNFSYVLRSALTLVRQACLYQPSLVFGVPACLAGGTALAFGARYAGYAIAGQAGHESLLVLASLFLGMSFVAVVGGLVADVCAVNRKLLEGIDGQVQRLRYRGLEVGDVGEMGGAGAPPLRQPGQSFLLSLSRRQMTLETERDRELPN